MEHKDTADCRVARVSGTWIVISAKCRPRVLAVAVLAVISIGARVAIVANACDCQMVAADSVLARVRSARIAIVTCQSSLPTDANASGADIAGGT